MEARLGHPARAGSRAAREPLEGGELAALLALAFLLLVTALWWALALWPAGGAPAWVEHARAVCFGARRDGLPSAGGWILLLGEPAGMVAALWVLGGRALRSAAAKLWAWPPGRAGVGLAALALTVGVLAAGARVAGQLRPAGVAAGAGTVLEMDRAAPEPGLLDQSGRVATLAALRGRPVLVTFAFAQCETVCPLLVHDALAVRRSVAAERRPALIVVTLDPWRDTPARLPAIARQWGLGQGEQVLSGPVPAALAVHAAWGATGARDARTGAVTHAPATFVVDAAGRVRYRTTGRQAELQAALSLLPAP